MVQLLPYSDSLLYSLTAYAVLAAAYSGWGKLLLRLMRVDPDAPDRAFTRIWLGWAVALLVLLLVNFLFALSAVVSALLFGAGILLNLLPTAKKGAGPAFPGWRTALFAAALVALSIWVASWAMLTPQVYDSGLYHFNSVRWINESPVPPGLGNLHVRFSYNQSFFVYAASLNLHPLMPYGHHLANSFLVLLLLAECLYHLIVRTGRRDEARWYPDIFLSLGCLLPVVLLVVTGGISSPVPDMAAAVLEYLLFWQFARLLEDRAACRNTLVRLSVVLALAGAMLVVKLSLLAYAAAAAALALFVARRDLREAGRADLRPVLSSLALGVLLVMAWMCKGYLLSGYPLFPSAFGGIGFDWSIPVETVHLEKKWITSWGRVPGGVPDEVLASWDWLGPWSAALLKQRMNVVYPLGAFLAAASCAAFFFLLPAWRERTGRLRPLLLLPMPVLAGLGYWFLTAPDVRFAQALFFLLPVSAGYLAARAMPLTGARGLAAVVCITLAIHGAVALWIAERASAIFRIPGVGYCAAPREPLKVETTDSGLQLLVTTTEGLCWDSPLPCTPYFNKKIRLRGASLREGFTIR